MWRHTTEVVETRTEVEWGVYEHHTAMKHLVAIKLFRRYFIFSWVWTG